MTTNDIDGKKISFWRLLSIQSIQIPIIQRDYAQGRAGREFLRRSFLKDIKRAIDSEQELLLDFVYGEKRNNCFLPLDGQQRLTTLWLIHWYIALRAGKLSEKTIAKTLSHFSYETRISSREFCQVLCKGANFDNFDPTKQKLKDYILAQKWFLSLWQQDPTIDAMLRMVSGTDIVDKGGVDIMDGIEELFDNTTREEFECYWERLTKDDAPISFYYKSLDSLGLTDDLYIKMNARGKQLTSFENFKADLIGYLRRQVEEQENKSQWEGLLDPKTGIPILMDTCWTDLFWKNRSEEYHIDEIYLAFINRFFWNELFVRFLNANEGEQKLADLEQSRSYRYLNADIDNDYIGLDPYCFDNDSKDIPLELFQRLRTVLNRVAQYEGEIPASGWNKAFSFIPRYKQDKKTNQWLVNPLTQVERIAFFALCKYFEEGDADKISLERWMRVVWNLISGEGYDGHADIRSTSAVLTAMRFIDRLDSHNVYESLCNQSMEENPSAFGSRWNEEIEKAEQILDGQGNLRLHKSGKTWEDLISEAENYAFFNGAIRFLYHSSVEDISWDSFDTKWRYAQEYFCDKGTNEKKDPQLLKALFSRFEVDTFYNVLYWWFQVFNNEPRTWRYFLLHRETARLIHELLLGVDNIVPRQLPDDTLNDWKETVLYQLTQTNLLDFILKSEEVHKYWIRTWGDYQAIYPRYGRKGILLNACIRDNFLQDPNVNVDKEYTVERTNLFNGWDIPFSYGGKHYIWAINDHIYLMRDDAPSQYLLKPADTKDKEKEKVCIAYDGQSAEELKRQLSELANKYLSEKVLLEH